MRCFLILAAGLACTATVSHAEVVNLSIQGRVTEIQYETQLGGGAAFLASTPLGTAFQFNYAYDTSTLPTNVRGGREETYFNPFKSSTLSLGGNSFSINPALDFNLVAVYLNGGLNFPRYFVFTNLFSGSVLIDGFRGIDFNADVFDTRRLASPSPGLPSSINVADYDTRSARIRFAKFGVGEVGVGLAIDRIVGGAPVPEPATWAMMIAGFGLVGGAMRRRQWIRSVAAA